MNTLFFPESNKGKRLTVDILIYWEGNRIIRASWGKEGEKIGLPKLPITKKPCQEG